MHRITASIGLTVSLLGCGSAGPSVAPVVVADSIGTSCAAEEFRVGLLIADPELGLAIRDDQNIVTPLLFRLSHDFGWSSEWPGEFEVRDRATGTVLATTGRRYKVGGKVADWHGNRFWTCADIFVLQ